MMVSSDLSNSGSKGITCCESERAVRRTTLVERIWPSSMECLQYRVKLPLLTRWVISFSFTLDEEGAEAFSLILVKASRTRRMSLWPSSNFSCKIVSADSKCSVAYRAVSHCIRHTSAILSPEQLHRCHIGLIRNRSEWKRREVSDLSFLADKQ